MPHLVGKGGMRKATEEEAFVLTTLARRCHQARQALRRELQRTPTAAEITKRVIRAIEYTRRCKDAVDRGELAPQVDDWGLLAEADGYAGEYARTNDFEGLSVVLSKWLEDQDANGTAAARRRSGDE
jgi:hypothetical protein